MGIFILTKRKIFHIIFLFGILILPQKTFGSLSEKYHQQMLIKQNENNIYSSCSIEKISEKDFIKYEDRTNFDGVWSTVNIYRICNDEYFFHRDSVVDNLVISTSIS